MSVIERLISELECAIQDLKHDDFKETNEKQTAALRERFCNLNPGNVCYTNHSILITDFYLRSWNYYAGLEYCEDEDVTQLGSATRFSDDCERIREILDIIKENE